MLLFELNMDILNNLIVRKILENNFNDIITTYFCCEFQDNKIWFYDLFVHSIIKLNIVYRGKIKNYERDKI